MPRASPSFQVFVKPAGAACNLACRYCYYLDKGPKGRASAPSRMPEALLETTIVQHIAASTDEIIRVSWHGGEPAILGI
ncbi:MAG: anaerobic sulfatase maturase, partial [Candidatus Aminicenantales bacterium]